MYTETALAGGQRLRRKTWEIKLPESAKGGRPRESESDLVPRAGLVTRKTLKGHQQIMWKVQENSHFLSLEPLDLNGEHQIAHQLLFKAPGVIDTGCLCVSDHKGEAVVADFFTNTGIFYTLQISYEQFYASEFNSDEPWCVMKQPVAYDIVFPQAVHAVDSCNILLALGDGALLNCSRRSPLDEFQVRAFDDKFSPSGLSWFFKSGADKVPGRPHLSVRSPVSIDTKNGLVVTCSINNTLKLWSMHSLTALFETTPYAKLSPRLQPSAYLKFNQIGDRIVVSFPVDGITLLVYQVDSKELAQSHKVSLGPDYASWLLTDMHLETVGQNHNILVGWKSGFDSVVRLINLPHIGDPRVETLSRKQSSEVLSLPDESDLDQFVQAIFSFQRYTEVTLVDAVRATGGFTHSKQSSLQEHVGDLLAEKIKSEDYERQSERLHWLSFDRVCRELEAQHQEFLGLAVESNTKQILVFRNGYASVLTPQARLRGALDSELYTDIAQVLPGQELYAVQRQLELLRHDNKLLKEQMLEIYQTVVDLSPNQDLVQAILVEHPDLGAELNILLNNLFEPTELSSQAPLTSLGANFLATTVGNYAAAAKTLLEQLTVFVVLASDRNRLQDGVSIYSRLSSLYSTALGLLSLREIGYPTFFTGLEILASRINVSVTENSSALPAYLWNELDITKSPHGSELFHRLASQGYEALESAAEFLPQTADAVLVKGLAMLDKGIENADVMIQSALPVVAYEKHPELTFLGPEFATAMGPHAVYLALSRRCEAACSLWFALRFAKLAAEAPEAEPQRHLLRLAMISGDLESAYVALANLHRAGAHVKEPLRNLLEAAIYQQKAETLQNWPFVGMTGALHEILTETRTIGGVASFKLRYNWCITREDFVGAATAVYSELDQLSPEELADMYMIILNALKCVAPEERWMVVKGKVVTIEDVEKQSKTAKI